MFALEMYKVIESQDIVSIIHLKVGVSDQVATCFVLFGEFLSHLTAVRTVSAERNW